MTSSAVDDINAPSLTKNCTCVTAQPPSCLMCASTPGVPKLFYIENTVKENKLFFFNIYIFIFITLSGTRERQFFYFFTL